MDVNWDLAYRSNLHMSRWPWSDLVSLVCRNWRGPMPPRVLELGCGAGANIPFFESIGAKYHGCDGSETIIGQLKERFPGLRLEVADFTQAIPFDGQFDLIVDRAALTHNTTAAIRSCLSMVRKMLPAGGKFIGVDWFSTEHSEFANGLPAGDQNTRTGYTSGQFADIGQVHFSDHAHLEILFMEFEILKLEHKISRSVLPDTGGQSAAWNVVAV